MWSKKWFTLVLEFEAIAKIWIIENHKNNLFLNRETTRVNFEVSLEDTELFHFEVVAFDKRYEFSL